MTRNLLKYLIFLPLLLPAPLSAQRPHRGRKPDVIQSEAPVSYDSLAVRRNELTARENRLKTRLDEARDLFASGPEPRSPTTSWNSNSNSSKCGRNWHSSPSK